MVLPAWPVPVPILELPPVPEPVPILELLPLPVPVPLPVLVVGLLASRLFKPWRGLSLGPPGLRGGRKSGPGPEDFDTPPPLLPPLLLVVVCGGLPPWPLGVCPLGVSGPGFTGPGAAASVRSTEVLERSFWICSEPVQWFV